MKLAGVWLLVAINHLVRCSGHILVASHATKTINARNRIDVTSGGKGNNSPSIQLAAKGATPAITASPRYKRLGFGVCSSTIVPATNRLLDRRLLISFESVAMRSKPCAKRARQRHDGFENALVAAVSSCRAGPLEEAPITAASRNCVMVRHELAKYETKCAAELQRFSASICIPVARIRSWRYAVRAFQVIRQH